MSCANFPLFIMYFTRLCWDSIYASSNETSQNFSSFMTHVSISNAFEQTEAKQINEPETAEMSEPACKPLAENPGLSSALTVSFVDTFYC